MNGEDLSALSLALPSGHVRRRPADYEEHVLDQGVAIAALALFILFLLGLVLAAEMVEVLVEHVTLFEGVVNLALVIRAWFLQHVVEQSTTSRGASRTFAVKGDDEGLVRVLVMSLATLVWRAFLLAFPAALGLLWVVFGLAALCGRVHLALAPFAIEDSTNRLFAGGEVGCYVEERVGAGRRVPSQLALEVPARGAQMKGTDDLGVLHAGELGALLGETPDVVPQRLIGLLTAPSEIPGVPRAHVRALEIAHEGPDQVRPVVDLVGRKMLRPGACRVCKVQRKIADDDGIISCAA